MRDETAGKKSGAAGVAKVYEKVMQVKMAKITYEICPTMSEVCRPLLACRQNAVSIVKSVNKSISIIGEKKKFVKELKSNSLSKILEQQERYIAQSETQKSTQPTLHGSETASPSCKHWSLVGWH